MNKLLKIFGVIITIIIITYGILLLLNGFAIGGFFTTKISYDKMEEIFNEDYSHLFTVANFLANLNYEEIYISNTMSDGIISVSGKNVEIKDMTIINSINTLKNHDYEVIIKEKNTVSFQRYSTLDVGGGVLFSVNGQKPTLQSVTRLQKLDKENWYYYEEN